LFFHILCYNNTMTKIHNIAKNTSYLTLALIGQKIISFVYFTILARNLGPAALGQYYFAISFTTIFAIFIDLGLANVITREIAKDNTKTRVWLGNIMSLKGTLALVTLLATFLIANLLGYSSILKELIYISCLSMILDSFTTTFFAVIRGFHSLIWESIASILFQVLVMGFGLWALFSGLGLHYLLLTLALASGVNFLYSWAILAWRFKIKLQFLYIKDVMRTIILITAPFALYAIFQRLYTYLDSVLLLSLAGEHYVGLYQVAFKIIFALQFLPMAFVASLYPALSHYWLVDKEQLVVSFKRAMNYLLIISLPISVGLILVANKVIFLFTADYLDAVLPMQITIAALVFIFLNFPIGSLLNACDRQKENTRNMIITTVVALGLNIVLIPRLQAVGASITVLVSSLVMFILGIIWVRKIIVYKARTNFITLAKVLLSSLVMAIFLIFCQNLNIFILIPIAGLIYFLVLFVLGGVKKADLKSIKESFQKK